MIAPIGRELLLVYAANVHTDAAAVRMIAPIGRGLLQNQNILLALLCLKVRMIAPIGRGLPLHPDTNYLTFRVVRMIAPIGRGLPHIHRYLAVCRDMQSPKDRPD